MSSNLVGTTPPSAMFAHSEGWSKPLAEAIAAGKSLAPTVRHRQMRSYLRDEYLDNFGNQPDTGNPVDAVSDSRGDGSDTAKTLYRPYPGDPKQGGRIAGLPEYRRKGGYRQNFF